MQDNVLNVAVERELGKEAGLDGSKVRATTSEGVVTLSGRVSTLRARRAAEQAAQRVRGIRAVTSEVEIREPGSSEPTDDEIAHIAIAALTSEGLAPAERVSVIVNHGWIYLEGAVDLRYQKVAAEAAVRGLPGVRGVSNLLTVRAHGMTCALRRT